MAYKNNGKRYLPTNRSSTKKRYPVSKYQSKRYPVVNSSPFTQNLSQNMRFGNKGNDVSGYVCREVIMQDAQGNKKMAREIQFFNSAKNIRRVRVED